MARRALLLTFGGCVLVSATLLFLVQPMFAKMAIPVLGDSPQVWNISVVFYQVVLLAGYLYAHVVRKYLSVRAAAALHAALVFVVFIFLPIRVPGNWAPPQGGHGIEIAFLGLLLLCVGAPFFVLSTTSPLIMSWFAASKHDRAEDPHFLYAASNAGSLAALIAYPFLVEPLTRLSLQTLLWTSCYCLFAALVLVCAASAARESGRTGMQPAEAAEASPPSRSDALRWMALAFVPSSLMLGVTTHLSNVIAPIPLLWSLPLALYLASLVVVFSKGRPPQSLFERFAPYAVLPLVMLLALQGRLPLVPFLAINLLLFFALALLCHGALAALRPARKYLTEFYLFLAVGGALGGIFNTFLAPLIFPNLGEYQFAIVLACLAIGAGRESLKPSFLDIVWPVALGVLIVFGFSIANSNLVILLALIAVFGAYGHRLRFALAVAAVFFCSGLFLHPYGTAIASERNFFGIKWVLYDPAEDFHVLIDGGTVHGIQSRRQAQLTEPLAYYGRGGPLGGIFRAVRSRLAGRSIAVMGLGAGAVACYAARGERWSFYEIDPQVVSIALDRRYFSFLSLCAPGAKIVTGDARLALEAEKPQANAMMVLDAYSGDQIPTHLLTVQALDLYLRHLSPDGVLAFNVTNNFFDLLPVLGNLAAARSLCAVFSQNGYFGNRSRAPGIFPSRWVAMSRGCSPIAGLLQSGRWKRLAAFPDVPLWTDDYSSLVYLKYAGH